MQASLVTVQGSKTWQVSFGQLAAGFVVPADKICSCTNGRATLKVRPSGTSTWQDIVAFNVVAATPGSATTSLPSAGFGVRTSNDEPLRSRKETLR
ncbi:MAG TPA: hypothetical protein VFO53_14510 [Casimicrobiaceae bacterium]|nr:hypothetical protein [Casimicrobiaceae bacterium]